jgi:KDO2-lipid IV(A) lauroyltransferase
MKETRVLRFAKGLLDLLATLPKGVNRKLAEVLGWIWFLVDVRHRRIALNNLELAWGDELDESARRNIARRNFIHLSRVMLEVPYLRKLTPENLDRYVNFHGLEHFNAALDKGKGLLVLASHFGNWEMMALAFSLRYHPANLVVRPLDNPILDTLINGIRTRGGNQLITKKGSVRSVLRLLGQGEVVVLLIDQNLAWYDGVFVPFFKEIACTNKALAVLALRTGAPVISVYNVRQPDGSYRVVFEPEVELVKSGDTTRDIEDNTANFNRVIESYVRRYPEQWFWVHQRWKTRPYQPWPRQT